MLIRPLTPADLPVAATIYKDAVFSLGRDAYNNQQLEAWASYPDDRARFEAQLLKGLVLVCEIENTVVAFAQLEPTNKIALLYCSAKFSRRGIASLLCERLEQHARLHNVRQIHTDASRISKPFFEKRGFQLVQTEIAVRLGIEIERFKMGKML